MAEEEKTSEMRAMLESDMLYFRHMAETLGVPFGFASHEAFRTAKRYLANSMRQRADRIDALLAKDAPQ